MREIAEEEIVLMPWRAFIDSDEENEEEENEFQGWVLMPWRAFIDSDHSRALPDRNLKSTRLNALAGIY